MSEITVHRVALGHDRVVEVVVGGDPDGPVVLAHHGTPSTAHFWADWSAPLAEAGLRLVACSRPGYGLSARQPGRRVADAAADSTALLDALGVGSVVSLGYSGGGPHALAIGALAPSRCHGVVVVAGIAPFTADGLDPLAGMGEENVEEFGAALAGEQTLQRWMAQEGEPMLRADGDALAQALGDLVDDTDREVLAEGWAHELAAEWGRVADSGTDGWVDDDLAFVTSWGFEPAAVEVPVTIWHAELDRMAPVQHSRWLASAVPGARYHEVEGLGHLALLRRHRAAIVDSARSMTP